MPNRHNRAMLVSDTASYVRMLDRMTLIDRAAHHRGLVLRSCRRWRRVIRDYGFDFARKDLRELQIRLAGLRIWRSTGINPS